MGGRGNQTHQGMEGATSDLWDRFWAAANKFDNNFYMQKFNSHISPEWLVFKHYSVHDTYGNELADAAARVGARTYEYPEEFVKTLRRVDEDALLILSRITAINMYHTKLPVDPERNTEKPNKENPNIDQYELNRLVHSSSHRTYYRDGKYRCSDCLQTSEQQRLTDW